MWTRPEKPIKIHPSQLVLGLYVWIDLPWDAHPFLYNKFRISTESQLAEIQSLSLDQIYCFPNKSTSSPGPLVEDRPEAEVQPRHEEPKVDLQQVKRDKLRAQKDAAARADRDWDRAAKQTREALLGLHRSPKQAGENLATLSRDTARMIAGGNEVLLHLLGDKNGEGPQFHALNVMTMSMILGKALSLSQTELTDLALGSLAHDAGKARVPLHLLKAKSRAKHEEEFYRAHAAYGVEMAGETGVFSPAALAIVRDHHEFGDGSGFPAGKSDADTLARIVGLVNRYDRYCGPESPEKAALMPAEALSLLYAKEGRKFDQKLLGLLIRILGVYPPGTLVQLNDGSLGLVVSPGRESLRPKVLVYDPEVNKDEAPVIDMAEAGDLKIEESLRPASLPPDVLKWINPRQRLSYFFSVAPPTP
jgi:HD-GYP domain-containing protein (c-di-GMP phosphodiesterase class II)